MARKLSLCVVVAVGIAATACSDDPADVEFCPAVLNYSVRVLVVDSVTRVPVENAEGWLFAGTYREQMQSSPGVLIGGLGRAGTYSVLVLNDGHLPWFREDVDVMRTACGPVTRELEAALQRR